MRRKLENIFYLILFLIILIIIWDILAQSGIWPRWLFPSPLKVFKTLGAGFLSGKYIIGILISLKRLFVGFFWSVLGGGLIGLAIAKNQLLKKTLGFLILGLQTLPSICWLPLALLWFGLNENAIIFVIIMGSILSVAIGVEGAIQNIPTILLKAGHVFGLRGIKLLRYIIIPAILPHFMTTLKQSWSFAWRSLMSGEMLFITAGLGQLLMMGRELNDMAQVMAVMLVIIIIGILFDKLVFGRLEKMVLRRWGLIK